MGFNGAFGFHNTNISYGGLTYKGTWDANANIPFLQSGIGVSGEYYIVGVAGTTNLDGTNVWDVGDWAIFEGATNQWQKISNSVITAYSFIQEEGVNLPQQNILDFQGAGVTASAGIGKTIVTIPGIPATTNYGLFAQTANSTPVTATIVETSIIGTGVGTLSVPANGFSVGASFRADLGGIISAKNNDKITIRVKTLAGVILLDSGLQTLPAITNDVWQLAINFTIRQVGAAGVASIVSLGEFHNTKSSNGTQEGFAFNTVNQTTFDTTIPNTLVITAQWSSNSALNSIYSDICVLNKIY